jgi:hypothetical protein
MFFTNIHQVMVRTIFNGTWNSGTGLKQLEVFHSNDNLIVVEIIDRDKKEFESIQICFDRRTAIKLHRELKKHISFINEIED